MRDRSARRWGAEGAFVREDGSLDDRSFFEEMLGEDLSPDSPPGTPLKVPHPKQLTDEEKGEDGALVED
jgi:hypothetical protein